MCDLVCFRRGIDVEDRGIIPKCLNGLDSKTIHPYNIYKKKFD